MRISVPACPAESGEDQRGGDEGGGQSEPGVGLQWPHQRLPLRGGGGLRCTGDVRVVALSLVQVNPDTVL